MLRILILMLVTVAMGFQREIPNAGDPTHPAAPKWCQATDSGGYKANCGICHTTCEDGNLGQEDNQCKNYCRKGFCKCHISCSTLNHAPHPEHAEVAP